MLLYQYFRTEYWHEFMRCMLHLILKGFLTVVSHFLIVKRPYRLQII